MSFPLLTAAAVFFRDAPAPDVRDVSWWLNSGAHALGMSREAFWTLILSLNLLALVWFLRKVLFQGKSWSIPMSLRERGKRIQTSLQQAEAAHQESQARLAEIEARIAQLPAEVAALRREAETESEREYQRLVNDSRQESDRIALAARQEIESATKNAQKELKNFAAALALDLAEKRVRERLTPTLDQAVVRAAIQGLKN